jgi:predicted RNA-binding Zn ribbon-like protein
MPDPEFILLGDALWLDLVNTARSRTRDRADRLHSPADYHRWTKSEKLASDAEEVAFEEVLEARERLTGLAVSLAAGRRPPAASVDGRNRALARMPGRAQLLRSGGRWSLHLAPDGALRALEAVAWSAATTLSDPGAAVRECAGAACDLFFLDRTPGHTRRFCSAASCGQAARVERRRRPR